MALKKTDMYRTLWQSCDELRGGMDASQYKDYILTLLFVKYVSDKYDGVMFAPVTIPDGGSFADMVALDGDKEIGDKMNKITKALAEANEKLRGVIELTNFNDPDKLGDGKEMVDRLSALVRIFNGLNLGQNRIEGDDLLGDAYEYLMRHFATESGKSKGQFYTPSEVSQVLAKVLGIPPDTSQNKTAYDPTCGSGSLLLKVADEAPNGLTLYGQERDNATAALARMNTIMHNQASADIHQGNTLTRPKWHEGNQLERFDFAVANPPFSDKSWTNGLVPDKDRFRRFTDGVPPTKNGDYAFLLHILKSLKSTGKAAVILPHGVLFRGNVEADLRRILIQRGVIKGIIGLPANLFYGTGIPACIIVIDKALQKQAPHGLFMVDASQGFIKDGNKNRLRQRDIHQIVDVFTHQTDVPRYARMVPYEEIEANEFNLNIPRYIDSSEPEDRHDLHAHLNGGIPQTDLDDLQAYWQVFPTLRQTLFTPLTEPVTEPVEVAEVAETMHRRESYSQFNHPANQIKPTILNHPEFKAFSKRALLEFANWWQLHRPRLQAINAQTSPKQLIQQLSEALLAQFADLPLLDNYAIYQLLMDYWQETLQDDLYLLVQDGWHKGAQLRELIVEKGKKSPEPPDLTIGKKKYKADLLPPRLLINRYFAEQQAQLEALQAKQETASQALADFIEEDQSAEEPLLEEATNDKGNVTKTNINNRLKEITASLPPSVLEDAKTKPSTEPFTEPVEVAEVAEYRALKKCLRLMDAESKAKSAVKTAQTALDKAVFAHYPTLTTEQVQQLAIDDKWHSHLQTAVQTQLERVTQRLTTRLQTLEARYATPLPQLQTKVQDLSQTVADYLAQMGVQWQP